MCRPLRWRQGEGRSRCSSGSRQGPHAPRAHLPASPLELEHSSPSSHLLAPPPDPPQSTEHCDWLYGIFGHETSCTRYWTCWNGENYKKSTNLLHGGIFKLLSPSQAQRRSNSASAASFTTRRPTPVTGPRMLPDARSIVSGSYFYVLVPRFRL